MQDLHFIIDVENTLVLNILLICVIHQWGSHLDLRIGLNVWLVPALLPFFGISPYTFFCLALVPALWKRSFC